MKYEFPVSIITLHFPKASTKVQDRLFDVVETRHDMERDLVMSFCGEAESHAKRIPFMRSMSIAVSLL